MPKISVLMPVYNAEEFLDESISSILNQSFQDFEFLILDDGSTDNSLKIIQKYAQLDQRIEFSCNKTNKKNATCRNTLLQKANTEFIAWMDADDISMPQRLKIQYNFLQNNPEIDIVGSARQNYCPPLTDYQIKTYLLLYGCPLINPSTMIRLKKIKKYKLCYDSKFTSATDYKFWVDCAPFVKFANLKEVLIYYRTHPNQISQKHQKTQKKNHLKIMKEQFKKFNIIIEVHILERIAYWKKEKHSYQDIVIIKKQIFYPIINIKNFYGYSNIHNKMLAQWLLKIFNNLETINKGIVIKERDWLKQIFIEHKEIKENFLKIFYYGLCRNLGMYKGRLFFIKEYGLKNYLILRIKNITFVKNYYTLLKLSKKIKY